MQVVFISNHYNHHQAPFSEAMNKLTHGNYYFIATKPMDDERIKMGWEIADLPTFVKFQYLNKNSKLECQNLIDNADVVIIGSAPSKLIRKRLACNKLTFRYSERLLKKDGILRFCAYAVRSWLINGWRKNFYMLCASAYTASDYYRMFSFRNKCFKWGYFPKVQKYDNIDSLIEGKVPFTLLWVGRFINLKHPEVPVKLVRELKDKGYNVHLSLIGDGPLKKELEDLKVALNIENQVEILGFMSPDKVRTYMEQSEIFLFTSDKHEGWGAVLNESMNSGCAVVSSHAIGSSAFLIKDGINGLIYKDGDTSDLFTKIKWLLDNPDSRKKIGLSAYHTMANDWNAENAAIRLLNLVSFIKNGQQTPYEEGPCSKAPILYNDWYH